MSLSAAHRTDGGIHRLIATSRQVWRELPAALAIGVITIAGTMPVVGSVFAGAPAWVLGVSTLPFFLVSTGIAHVGVRVSRGERPRVESLAQGDVGVALILSGAMTLSAALIQIDGVARGAGFALTALTLFTAPIIVGYGAIRDRRGISAIRGGLILTAAKPLEAVTLLSVGILVSFALIASAGVLGLVAPVFLATFIAHTVAGMLTELDIYPTSESVS
ncbi:hypothetical protein [Microcella alkaliphila]|uniref:Uncharacterized protein n=1 Tax=Microcella alkaliphila TaxID=279828 RepID=A0A0U5BSW5_9MICO|nr:hypothetical protein [Microcella alkaliphila]BAU33478.1 uncharacterized protein MalAC0309_2643 [Microcella alkaliphila]